MSRRVRRRFTDEQKRAGAEFAALPVPDATGGLLDLHAARTSFVNALDEVGLTEGVGGELRRHKPQRVLGQHSCAAVSSACAATQRPTR